MHTVDNNPRLSGSDFNDEIRVVESLFDFPLATIVVIRVLVVQGSGKLSPGIVVISTAMHKWNTDTLASVFARAVNLSIESSTVPAGMKQSVVTRLLKKTGLDTESLVNYRPIRNLCYFSIVIEKIAASQIR